MFHKNFNNIHISTSLLFVFYHIYCSFIKKTVSYKNQQLLLMFFNNFCYFIFC